MKISVVICTWNRSEFLLRTLEEMTKLAIPADVEWEVLVVDNNSTDRTQSVAQSFATKLPLRILFEPNQGKSHALNRAVKESSGNYILWTDDDVLVDEKWLSAYVDAFRRWPDAALFGGTIEPWFQGNPPNWLEEEFPRVAVAFAARDLGPNPLPLGEAALPFGANMAVRREEQLDHLYDTSLGPRPGSALRGEETAVARDMLECGETGWWVPDARVKHLVPRERQTVPYLRGFFRGDGALSQLREESESSAMLFGRPRWLWRHAVVAELKYRYWRVLRRPDRWVPYLVQASFARGRLSGESRIVPR